jgi:hypothetical protein
MWAVGQTSCTIGTWYFFYVCQQARRTSYTFRCKATPKPSSLGPDNVKRPRTVTARRQSIPKTLRSVSSSCQHPEDGPGTILSFHTGSVQSRVSSSSTETIELGEASDVPLARPKPLGDVSTDQARQYGPCMESVKTIESRRLCRVLGE